jgi:hypothetical protein
VPVVAGDVRVERGFLVCKVVQRHIRIRASLSVPILRVMGRNQMRPVARRACLRKSRSAGRAVAASRPVSCAANCPGSPRKTCARA